jgi:CheY-like chemotaxis protein
MAFVLTVAMPVPREALAGLVNLRYGVYCSAAIRQIIKAPVCGLGPWGLLWVGTSGCSIGEEPVAIRVLIADDHDVTRKGVRTILSHEGIEVCGEASNGIEAVTNAVELRPDLVILDLTMPVMGGFDAARELLKILPDLPILVYSMHDDDQLVRESRRVGVRGFVTKSDICKALPAAVNALVVQKATFFPESWATSPS